MSLSQCKPIIALTLILSIFIFGCVNPNQHILDSDQNQLQLRQMQSRSFETRDREKTLRSVIQTLQDLRFVVDKANLELGTISATKLDGYALRMTVTVMPQELRHLVVRANAQYNIIPVTDPEPYQQFFAALEKSMFLTAQQVN